VSAFSLSIMKELRESLELKISKYWLITSDLYLMKYLVKNGESGLIMYSDRILKIIPYLDSKGCIKPIKLYITYMKKEIIISITNSY